MVILDYFFPLPSRELTQLNKQDNTNFNLLGGHVVELGAIDTTVVFCLTYLLRILKIFEGFSSVYTQEEISEKAQSNGKKRSKNSLH
jgi:hypothetical protein